MINSVQKKILILALFAGEIMMKSGAEIYRVEDTIIRICKACHVDYVECFATTTGIFLSVDSGEADNDMHTFIKRIHDTDINLEKISEVNTFSRVFTSTDLSIDDGFEQLKKINAKPEYNIFFRLLGSVIIGAFFCPIFNGTFRDMLVAGGISGISFLISHAIGRLHFPDFIRIFVSCAGAAGLTIAVVGMGLIDSISPVAIAATTIFLPGVAITNAARDLLSGDMQSGVARLAEACIIAVAIAGGVAIGLQIWMLRGGVTASSGETAFATPWFLLFGFCVTLGFCLLFNSPKNLFIPTAGIGAVGMYLLVKLTAEYGAISASFFGTCAIAILAEFASRAGKDATTLFIIPGVIPFVPGYALYETMHSMLAGDYSVAVETGTQALLMAGSVAIALALIATIARLVLAVIRRFERFLSRK